MPSGIYDRTKSAPNAGIFKKGETSIDLFKPTGKEIRRVFHNDEWYFSIVDVIESITDSDRPRKYWADLKSKLTKEGAVELSEKIGQFKILRKIRPQPIRVAKLQEMLVRI